MLVFVYGTLKRRFGNHSVMVEAGGKFVGTAMIEGYAAINVPWFPYAIKKDGSRLKGEVFFVDSEGLKMLDLLEGYPSHYNRTVTNTPYGLAWVYHTERDMAVNIKKFGFTEEWIDEDNE